MGLTPINRGNLDQQMRKEKRDQIIALLKIIKNRTNSILKITKISRVQRKNKKIKKNNVNLIIKARVAITKTLKQELVKQRIQ